MSAHDQFYWRGRLFKWDNPSKCFACDLEQNCRAYVNPQGLRWEANIIIRGGSICDVGATPADALDAAHKAWLFRVECVGEERAQ